MAEELKAFKALAGLHAELDGMIERLNTGTYKAETPHERVNLLSRAACVVQAYREDAIVTKQQEAELRAATERHDDA